MTRQVAGSLLVALVIVAAAILAVTAQLGPTSVAEQEAREERLDQRLDQQEELREQRQEREEERREGGSGPG